MITVTERANTKIKKLLEQRGQGVGIKIGVKTTGCSGLAYVLEYYNKLEYDPSIIVYGQKDNFVIVIDKKHEPYLSGLVIDYVKQGINEGFEFQNPNERDRCGCGESFRV